MADIEINETRLRDQVMGDLETFTRGFVNAAAAQAQKDAPERTGNLKRLIKPDAVRRVGPWTLASGVSSLARYSAPVHEGARPHVIRARNAAALSFFWPKVGRQVFFKSVNHPGNAGQPFLRNAVHAVAAADPRITVGER